MIMEMDIYIFMSAQCLYGLVYIVFLISLIADQSLKENLFYILVTIPDAAIQIIYLLVLRKIISMIWIRKDVVVYGIR